MANEQLTLEQALEFAHKENQSLHEKHDGLLTQLHKKQVRIDELHRLHHQTQTNLEHYRESSREQRLLDKQKFDQEKQILLAELGDELSKIKDQLKLASRRSWKWRKKKRCWKASLNRCKR